MKDYKVVIFDLDGTLLDTVPGINMNLNRSLEKIGIPLKYTIADTRGFIGKGTDHLLRCALGERYSRILCSKF